MRQPIKKKASYLSIIEAWTIFALAIGLPGFVQASDGVTVNYGTSQNITGPDSVCWQVANNFTTSLYVPTASVSEWQSFYNNLPAGVTKAGCPCVPNGTETASGSACPGYDIYDSCGNWIRFDSGYPCT